MKNNREIVVSIIIPVYNAASFLRDSIGDILAQSFKAFELICVDDGSEDDSGHILDEFALKDNRVIVIHQNNKGGGAARNVGLERAIGKYLLFLDSDDRFEIDMLEKIVRRAESDRYEIVAFDGDLFVHGTNEHKIAPWLLKKSGEIDYSDPFLLLNTSIWNKLFLREYINGINIRFQEVRTVDTMFFSFISVVYARNIGIVREKLIHYRINNNASLISNSDRCPSDTYVVLKSIKEKLEADGMYDRYKKVFQRHSLEYLHSRLHIMKSYKGFKELYDLLHNGGLGELNLLEQNESELEESNYNELRSVNEKSVGEFLFERKKIVQDCGLLGRESYILPSSDYFVGKNRIILYGGGNVGKDYFRQVSSMPEIELLTWVDRNYEKIGFPLCSPEEIVKLEFDFILIAVADEKTAISIKKDLLKMSVSEDKIVWIKPEVL